MSHTHRRRHRHKAHCHRGRFRQDVPTGAEPEASPRKAPAAGEQLVTDHAVLRWLERVTGIDVARQVREEILADGRDALIAEVGKGRIHVAGSNAVLRIVNGRVITVTTKDGHG